MNQMEEKNEVLEKKVAAGTTTKTEKTSEHQNIKGITIDLTIDDIQLKRAKNE